MRLKLKIDAILIYKIRIHAMALHYIAKDF